MPIPFQLMSGRVRRDYREAKHRGHAAVDKDRLANQQLARLTVLWDDAVADVPYYAALVKADRAPRTIRSWETFRSLPVLTRQILQDQPEQFVRRSGPADGIAFTAGSTGTPLQVGMNQSERDLMRIVKLSEW